MNKLSRISSLVFLSVMISGCASLSEIGFKRTITSSSNPLKSVKDLKIEKILMSGSWKYERQSDDCKDTNWVQSFHADRYYKSIGAACLVPNAFTVDAESWHLKDQILYVTNLSPNSEDDIILRYGIAYLDENKLTLSSGQYTYTFTKE